MPAANLERPIGDEDSPHVDDVLSRAASKVFTRGRSSIHRNKVRVHGDAALVQLCRNFGLVCCLPWLCDASKVFARARSSIHRNKVRVDGDAALI